MRLLVFDNIETNSRITGGKDVIAPVLEDYGGKVKNDLFIINNEDAMVSGGRLDFHRVTIKNGAAAAAPFD